MKWVGLIARMWEITVQKYWLDNAKEINHLEKLDKEDRIIAKLILQKQGVRM